MLNRGKTMKLFKNVLLGSAAAIVSVGAAQAADLPSRKAAPVEYVKICDAYGSGFFYIPGTDTCLKVGGAVVGEYRGYSSSYRVSRNTFANGVPNSSVTIPGFGSSQGALIAIGNFANPRSSDNQGFAATGRIELDARTGTSYGVLRTFLRIESYYGSDTSAATGSLGNPFANPVTFRNNARESTILNKAFIQFAGLTAGRVQSFFDFYTDNINWEALRVSNATVGALAYTYTFGNGFAGSISLEDNVSRRGLIGSTVGNAAIASALTGLSVAGSDTLLGGTRYVGQADGAQIPEIVGNLRYDAPWGAAQISGAAHQIRTSLYNNNAGVSGTAGTAINYAYAPLTQDDYGFAVQAGVQGNLDKLLPNFFAPGDKVWVQAVYAKGAVGYTNGNNLSFEAGGVNANTFYGYGNGGTKASNGYSFNTYDCVWTALGHCDKSDAWAIAAALKHYWTPTISSGFFGSFMNISYSNAALLGIGNGIGALNTDEYRVGTNLVWTPVKNFDIGGEIMYLRDNHHNRPAGLAVDPALWAVGQPGWKGVNSTVEGRLRVQRSF
jgi:hypothetical protein